MIHFNTYLRGTNEQSWFEANVYKRKGDKSTNTQWMEKDET